MYSLRATTDNHCDPLCTFVHSFDPNCRGREACAKEAKKNNNSFFESGMHRTSMDELEIAGGDMRGSLYKELLVGFMMAG